MIRLAFTLSVAFGTRASAAETPTTNTALPASIAEAGLPFFEVFTPRQFHGHGQVWSGAQDRAGLLYFGNLGRVLIYDGSRWTPLPVPGTTYVRALAVDADDTLWIGAVDELGFAKTDATGARTFVSLKEKLPEAARTCGEIWKVMLTPRGPLFQTNTWLLRWDGEKFATLRLPDASSWQMIQLGDHLQLNQAQQGWFRLNDNGNALSLAEETRPDILKNRGLTVALPALGDQPTLLGSARIGLLHWTSNDVTPFAPEMSAELGKSIVYGGARLPDSRAIITTLQGGAYIIDAQGRLLAHLDQKSGLPANTVINVFVDRSGSAWLCLEQGLVRIDPRPWLSWFSEANGVPRGGIGAPLRFNGTLYASSNTGLLKFVPSSGFHPARVEPVAGSRDFLNHVVIADDALIGLGVQGLFSWKPGQESVALPGKAANVESFVASLHQPGRWFAIADGNIFTFRNDHGKWSEEGAIPNLHNVSGLIETADGAWWLSTSRGEALRVTFPSASLTSVGEPQIEHFGEKAGLPKNAGWVRVTTIGDRILFQCEQGIFRFNPTTNRVEPTEEFGRRFSDGSWTPRALTPDPKGGAWIAAKRVGEAEIASQIELGYVDANGWHAQSVPQINLLNDVGNMRIEPGENGVRPDVLWISGHAGVIRIDLDAWRTWRDVVPEIKLREITTRDGARMPLAGNWELPFARRTLAIKFSVPASAKSNYTFKSTLIGAGDPIEQIDTSAERTFTGLSPGDYTLQVTAQNENGPWLTPVSLNFTVRPPWWRTDLAWAIYFTATVLSIAALVRWRTAALRRRAHALELIVAERTEALRRSNLELTRLHQLELDEKIAAKLGEEKARLEVLRYQLNPHFLFNALTSVCAHLPPGLAKAREIVEQLVDFCQLTLFRPASGDNPTIAQEVKMLRAYLDIEQTRWGDLLIVELEVTADASAEKIPPLLLLPLVENALKYGRATARGPLHIQLRAHRDAHKTLVIEIANTGEWVETANRGNVPSLGIGLENLRQRLQRYYPQAHEFKSTAQHGWVTFTLTLHAAPREI